jgi:hypothetical protein
VAALAAALVLGTAAAASEAEPITLSDSTPKVREEYPPIPGIDPTATALAPTLSECRSRAVGNVLIPIEMNFRRDFGHVLEVVVTWPNPEAVDVDIWFFDETGEIIADSATGDPKESVRLGSLANGQYYLCVRNFSGPNTGFVLDASVRYLATFTRPPSPPPPTGTSSPLPRTSASTTPQPGTTGLKEQPAASAEPVNTPGPDGPFADKGLINVAGSRQAAPDEGGRGWTEIALLAATGAIAAAGLVVVAFRIRRDTRT